tara:strand:- start:1779 stop:2006 length:228 start_codon:yes stop_codon:yes gene_type:complete
MKFIIDEKKGLLRLAFTKKELTNIKKNENCFLVSKEALVHLKNHLLKAIVILTEVSEKYNTMTYDETEIKNTEKK